jgi:hypothetical protein
MATVIFGAPALTLARITRPVVEDGMVKVADAVALPVIANAVPPEADLSVTIRPELDGERVIRSLSMLVVVVDAAADFVAADATAADLRTRTGGVSAAADDDWPTVIAFDNDAAVATRGVLAAGRETMSAGAGSLAGGVTTASGMLTRMAAVPRLTDVAARAGWDCRRGPAD